MPKIKGRNIFLMDEKYLVYENIINKTFNFKVSVFSLKVILVKKSLFSISFATLDPSQPGKIAIVTWLFGFYRIIAFAPSQIATFIATIALSQIKQACD